MYKCDPTDAVILRFVVDFWHSGKMTIRHHKGREYFWLDYKYLLQEIPIIGITSKVALKRRFTRFVDVGLMRFYLHHGHLPCYRFTKKYTKLVFKNDSTKPRHSSDTREGGKLKSAGGVNPKVQGGDRLGLPMYSSIIDPSIKIKKREGETLLQEKDSPALSQDNYSSNGSKEEKTGKEKDISKAKPLDMGSRGYAGEEENVRLSEEEYQKLLKKYPEEFVRLKIDVFSLHIRGQEKNYHGKHYVKVARWCREDFCKWTVGPSNGVTRPGKRPAEQLDPTHAPLVNMALAETGPVDKAEELQRSIEKTKLHYNEKVRTGEMRPEEAQRIGQPLIERLEAQLRPLIHGTNKTLGA